MVSLLSSSFAAAVVSLVSSSFAACCAGQPADLHEGRAPGHGCAPDQPGQQQEQGCVSEHHATSIICHLTPNFLPLWFKWTLSFVYVFDAINISPQEGATSTLFFEREETVCGNERAESGTFGGWIDSKVHLNSSLSD